ncbi:holo-ACP synthase [Cellulomonas soli]|uniref:holo-ACP synthase n=1 Tax=Cellulomonas soli TaxID=931535 RepID=UPI003F87F9CF
MAKPQSVRHPEIGLGVDVVDVARLRRVLRLRGPTLGGQVFTAGELGECHGSVPRLAARLAAKEATAKALGTGIGPVGWRDVEVRTGPSGAPHLTLAGAARALADARGLDRWAVSLSHDTTHALAVVVATPTARRIEQLP